MFGYQDAVEPAGIVAVVIAVTIGIRLFAGMLDRDRIREYLEGRGCKLLRKEWTPFGQGWFGEATSRIYLVEFEDQAGNRRRATVKTSLWTGVFLTDDTIIRPAAVRAGSAANPELERLRAENERLRAELEQRNDTAT